MAGLLKGCKTFYDSFNENNFLLAGNYYQKYVSKSYGMTYTGEAGTMRTFDIPNTANVDSAVYDPRTERIYFFVGSTVRKVKLAIPVIHSYLSVYSVPLFQKYYCVYFYLPVIQDHPIKCLLVLHQHHQLLQPEISMIIFSFYCQTGV